MLEKIGKKSTMFKYLSGHSYAYFDTGGGKDMDESN
jgi:hypothetical protein